MAKTIQELKDAVADLSKHTTPTGKVKATQSVFAAIVDKLEELEGAGG